MFITLAPGWRSGYSFASSRSATEQIHSRVVQDQKFERIPAADEPQAAGSAAAVGQKNVENVGKVKLTSHQGSGCGSVGKKVVSDTWDLQFKFWVLYVSCNCSSKWSVTVNRPDGIVGGRNMPISVSLTAYFKYLVQCVTMYLKCILFVHQGPLAHGNLLQRPTVRKLKSVRRRRQELKTEPTQTMKCSGTKYHSNLIILRGPWWWSSGQCARLLLRRSELESRCKVCVWKERK